MDDIVVRAVADAKHPEKTQVGDVCSSDPTVISADASIDDAIQENRSKR